ncbi:hypothetical protein PR202_gb29611 [Eleusine coracana subsp. coracana]|uniref:Serine/threonine-protein phosphatase n=1 Tax=Eleusine coracana subsp. coracana TaxID=191504 RepID=A0AAV5FXN3_ELECO|nr:hypothetical protein PR202_gb29611 [Eleusine coracana subsp. coracana]
MELRLGGVDDMIRRLVDVRRWAAGNNKMSQQVVSEWEIRQLCAGAKEVFMRQPNLLELDAPINICGDVHGQYRDLLRMFKECGFPHQQNNNNKHLFLGDYVDRGEQSIETACLLLAYKVRYPEHFFLLRGNHEVASVNRIYGFYDECKRRYSVRLWRAFTDCFNCLPVAALVDDRILCVHGGISPHLRSLDQIRELPRPSDVPDSGLRTLACSATSYGRTPPSLVSEDGLPTKKGESPTPSAPTCSTSSYEATTSTYSAGRIRWFRTDTSSSQIEDSSPSSPRQITAESLTMMEQ